MVWSLRFWCFKHNVKDKYISKSVSIPNFTVDFWTARYLGDVKEIHFGKREEKCLSKYQHD
jgi:hypothetical protein